MFVMPREGESSESAVYIVWRLQAPLVDGCLDVLVDKLDDAEPCIRRSGAEGGSLVISVTATSTDAYVAARSAYQEVQPALVASGITATASELRVETEEGSWVFDVDDYGFR
jgi:hypothetical protein